MGPRSHEIIPELSDAAGLVRKSASPGMTPARSRRSSTGVKRGKTLRVLRLPSGQNRTHTPLRQNPRPDRLARQRNRDRGPQRHESGWTTIPAEGGKAQLPRTRQHSPQRLQAIAADDSEAVNASALTPMIAATANFAVVFILLSPLFEQAPKNLGATSLAGTGSPVRLCSSQRKRRSSASATG